MTSYVLPLHFAPSHASSSQNSNVDSYLQYCEVDTVKRSFSESSLTLKDPGFLVSQIPGGGGQILPGLRKNSLTPPNFIFEQQTESHMKAGVLR